MTDVQRYLMPAGTVLPAGVSIPAAAGAAAVMQLAAPQLAPQQQQELSKQQAFAALAGSPRPQQLPVPAVAVPAAALQHLELLFSFSLAHEMADPVSQSQQLLQWASSVCPSAAAVGVHPPAQQQHWCVHHQHCTSAAA